MKEVFEIESCDTKSYIVVGFHPEAPDVKLLSALPERRQPW